MKMKISKAVERISENELTVSHYTVVGFGMSAERVLQHDHVKIVPRTEFEKLLRECKPTAYWDKGFNRGAPVNGLELRVGPTTGIRYLVDATGAGIVYRFADADTLV